MGVLGSFYTYLSTHAGIQAVLGNPPRIYPGIAPNSASRPYATYARIASQHVHHTIRAAGLASCTIQVDVWAANSVDSESVVEAFRLALDGMTTATWGTLAVKRVTLESERDLFESPDDGSQEGLFRVSMDFEIWYAESVPAL